jgi:DNA-binding transcriptional LysR family regulator
MLPSVKIEDIETALKVIECKHFTRVGAKLHKDQTTVSRCIKRVERELGAELIDRSSHPVRPTKAGVVFLYWGRKGLHALARGFSEVRRANEPCHAVLHIGYTSYLDLDVLAYIQNMSSTLDSGFAHREHSSSSSEIVSSILTGKWDCGFIITPAATEGLVGIPIYREHIGLVLPNDHPLARKRRISISDLRGVPLILPAKERNIGFRSWFVERCDAEGVKLKVAHEVANPHEAWYLASQHAGLALMPKSASSNLRKGNTVFRVFAAEDLYVEIQLVFRDEPQRAFLATFVKAILRMRERLHDKLHYQPQFQGVIPRPDVKPWSGELPVHHRDRALSA